MVMGDSFSINVFKDSLKKFFETDATGKRLSLCLSFSVLKLSLLALRLFLSLLRLYTRNARASLCVGLSGRFVRS